MRRQLFAIVLGAALVLGFVATPAAQSVSTQIQIAINQLTTGITPFTFARVAPNGYLNFGNTTGVNGYGIRDSGGFIQLKQSGDPGWTTISASGSGCLGCSYWTRVAEASLSGETALGLLASGLILNTTTTGVPTIYTGTSCTNQFTRALSAAGVATCATVILSTDTTGTLLPARGGTGLTSGTSGGILYYSGSTTLASSGILGTSQLVLGGGAAATPTTLGSLGTTVTLLHGNAAGAPTFGAVVLTTDVSGILPGANGGTANGFFAVTGPTTSLKTFTFPNASATVLTSNTVVSVPQGGTGFSSYTIGDFLYADSTTTLAKRVDVSTGNALISGGVGAAPSYGKIGLTTHISGTLPVANGGTGITAWTTGDLLYASGATSLAGLTAVATGRVLISAGLSTPPAWSTALAISTISLGANLTFSSTAPTVSSGFGSTPSITAGTATSFRVNVGTGGTATAGVLGMPTATTGWNCHVEDETAVIANAADRHTIQIGTTTSTVTVENQTISTGVVLAWTASDILALTCAAF